MVLRKCTLSTGILFGLWIVTALLLFHYENSIRNSLSFKYNIRAEQFYKSQLEINQFDDDNPQVLNLPDVYLAKKKRMPRGLNRTCAKFPSMFDLEFNNLYWQVFTSSNGTYYLYNAYYDDRREAPNNHGTVRIVGMINIYHAKVTKVKCLLWFEKRDKPTVVQMRVRYVWKTGWGIGKDQLQPYLLECPLPKDKKHEVPMSVSLIEKACESPKNNLKVHNKKSKEKQGFSVCVKGLDETHRDISVRLIEWIELLQILGAHQIHFYLMQAHPNVLKVLKHYTGIGQVTVTPITLPGGFINLRNIQHMFLTSRRNHKRKTELIPYNDCFYKHRTSNDYIALLDIDEVIMPTKLNSWKDIITKAIPIRVKKGATAFCFRNVYFMDEHMENRTYSEGIPKYMHMLQHIYRAHNFTKPGHYVKCFHNTSAVVSLHNHFPFSCLPKCKNVQLATAIGKLNHYRKGCVGDLKKHDCKDMKDNVELDTKIWDYKETLMARVRNTLKLLNIHIPND